MTADPINHFLLVFDHEVGRLVNVEEFGEDSRGAVARYQEVERLHAKNRQMDIVLVGSDSLDTVKVTHSNYFETVSTEAPEIEEYLRRVLRDSGVS